MTHDQTEAMTLADRLAVLDRGQLQQVGTPQDLYDSPANAFVAGFIGQPSMNLLEARIERDRVVVGSLQIPLPCGTGERRAGDGVRLGIRPEEVRVSGLAALEDQPARNDRSATGIVRLVEPIAGQIWVTVELEVSEPFTTIVGLADKGFNLRPRERVTVSVVGARLHLFEPETGVRLGSGV